MRHTFLSVITNSGLLVVVVVLLSAPLLLGQLLATSQSGALGATSSRPVTTAAALTVYPNTSDFSKYAQFDNQPKVTGNLYQTDVTFTAFSGQQAAYNGLLTLYNTSDRATTVTAETGTVSGQMDHSRVWVTLDRDDEPSTNLLTQVAKQGATQVTVGQVAGFSQGSAVVGDQPVTVQRVSGSTLVLAQPLRRQVGVGEAVYLGAVFFDNAAKPTVAMTRSVRLEPNQKATMNLVVATDAGPTDKTKMVMPLIITSQQ